MTAGGVHARPAPHGGTSREETLLCVFSVCQSQILFQEFSFYFSAPVNVRLGVIFIQTATKHNYTFLMLTTVSTLVLNKTLLARPLRTQPFPLIWFKLQFLSHSFTLFFFKSFVFYKTTINYKCRKNIVFYFLIINEKKLSVVYTKPAVTESNK